MQIDTGTAIIILAVLIFYLRLIIIQRERAKRLTHQSFPGKKKNARDKQLSFLTSYSILSQNQPDRVIAGLGIFAILAGVLLNLRVIPWIPVQNYWWVPVAAGIVAFSWAFK